MSKERTPKEAQGFLRRREMFSGFELVIFPLVTVVLIFMVVVPLGVLVYGGLTSVPMGSLSLDFTLKNYFDFFSNWRYLEALWHTIEIAVLTTLLAGAIGLFLAWLVGRTDVPMARLIQISVMAPFFMSPFMGALAWGTLMAPNVGLLNKILGFVGIGPLNIYSISGMVWVMSLYYTPYVFIFVNSALQNMDPQLEESGAMSGLNRRQVIFRITLPLVSPAILSGMLLTFVASAGQFGVPALLGTPFNFYVMTTYIFDLTHNFPGQFNLAASFSIVLLLIASVGVWAQNRLMRGKTYTTVTGKGFRPRLIELGPLRWPAFGVAISFLLLTVGLPLYILGYVSLIPLYVGDYSFNLLTLDNYKEVFLENQIAARAIGNTLFLAFTGATLGVLLGVVISSITLRSRLWYRKILDYIVILPVCVPAVVLGMALLWTYVFVPLPIYGTIWLLLIGYVTGFLPFAVRAITSSMVQIDKSLEEAATMVGASWLRTIKEVTFPLLRPGLIAGWMLLFIIFVRELAVSIFLYSPRNEVLSVMIYNRWEEGDYTALSAMAMTQVAFIAIVMVGMGFLFRIDLTKSQT